MAPIVVTGWIILTTVYVTLLAVLRKGGGPHAADEYCTSTSSTPCSRNDLLAFQVSSGMALTTCGILGFRCWHWTQRVFTILPATPEGRLFGYLPEAELLAAINFTFQFWDFWISLTIPEHATAIMLSHHLMAATVSWCSIQYQYLHYYGIFFLGITEVSSIFLVFVDLSKYFPPTPGTFYDQFIGLFCGPLFAVTFVYYRVWVWWPESHRLLHDVRAVTRSGRAHQLRPGATWVLYLFLALNVPLGLLQLYWTTIIYQEAKKTLMGS